MTHRGSGLGDVSPPSLQNCGLIAVSRGRRREEPQADGLQHSAALLLTRRFSLLVEVGQGNAAESVAAALTR